MWLGKEERVGLTSYEKLSHIGNHLWGIEMNENEFRVLRSRLALGLCGSFLKNYPLLTVVTVSVPLK